MLTELFRLVIRGERGEGKTVEIAAHHLPQCHPRLPHYPGFTPQKVPLPPRGLHPSRMDQRRLGFLSGSSVRSSSADSHRGERKRCRRRNSAASALERGRPPTLFGGGCPEGSFIPIPTGREPKVLFISSSGV